jgi:hypothetical protein
VRLRSTLLAGAAATVVVAIPAPASAGGGGIAAPGEASPESPPAATGERAPSGERTRARRRAGTRARGPSGGARPARRTLLTSFEVRRTRLFLYGRSARILFTLSGRRAAKIRLHVLNAADGARVASMDLGERAAGRHSVAFTGRLAGTPLPEGRYLLHIAGRNLRRGPSASSSAELEFRHHAFPLAGPFSWGGEGSRFGAGRAGHSHQGQDLAAAEGTPVVAPRGGIVQAVQYQAAGAGHYVVLEGKDENQDYVFMHLRTGSIPVGAGDRLRTGQLIGEVGTTGRSSGPHLHFEIWPGGWYRGGAPIDPLPLLRAWAG